MSQDEKNEASAAAESLKNEDAQAVDEKSKGKNDIDLILDIPLELSVELGRTKMLVNKLLQLGQGSVIDLNKPAGETLDICVNGKLVARGEVVVVDEKYGIRVTDIASPLERVKSLS